MKRIFRVLFSFLFAWMQLPCYYASSTDTADESSLSWLMSLYGYTLSQDITAFAQSNFQPFTVDAEGVTVTIQEILYDGAWMFTSATAQPSDDVILVPLEADVNDSLAGGYGENLREDSRTFLEAAQEEQKDLLYVSVMPAEYEQSDFYFLDHRQDAGLQSTLFSGAPVTLSEEENTIHIAIETTLVSQSTGEILSESHQEYPITIQRLATRDTKEYLPSAEDAPFEKIVLVQTDLATYVYPTWQGVSDDATPEYALTDAEGNQVQSGLPQDAGTYSFDTLPDTLYVKYTEASGAEHAIEFTAAP